MEKLTKEQIENLPEWITVREFEGYEVNCRKGIIRNVRTFRILKPNPNSAGYPHVRMRKYGKTHSKQLHRIVANAAFGHYNIPTEGLDACHLDEERHNPRIDNLVLATHKENMNFPKFKQRMSEAQKGEKNYWFGKHHSTEARMKMSEASTGKSLSEEHRKKISEANKGKKGYWFGKHLSTETKKKMSDAKQKKPVGAYKNGELIMTFQSTCEAGRNGFSQGRVSACCLGKYKTHKGYEWKYIK